MADKKISALTGASTPLAGTEVLPIVQSGATVKVAVSNLTAGRAVSALTLASTTGATFATTSGSVGIGTASPAATLDLGGNTASNVQQIFGRSVSDTSFSVRYTNGVTGTTAFVGALGLDYAGGTWADMAAIKFYRNSTSGELAFFASASAASGTEQMRVTNTGVTVTSGNLIPGTAAKGINFTANTAQAGMTSQLLNWFEEGTWTPTDASGAALSLTINSASYVRVGSLVNLFCSITYPATADATNSKIGGFPFTSGSIIFGIGSTSGSRGLNMNGAASATSAFILLQNAANIPNATLSTLTVVFSATYKV